MVLIPRVRGKVRGTGRRRRAIHRRQKYEAPARTVNSTSSNREPVLVLVEPVAAVHHEAEEVLPRRRSAPAAAGDPATALAAHVHREAERSLAPGLRGILVILHLDAVVAVHAHARRVSRRIR